MDVSKEQTAQSSSFNNNDNDERWRIETFRIFIFNIQHSKHNSNLVLSLRNSISDSLCWNYFELVTLASNLNKTGISNASLFVLKNDKASFIIWVHTRSIRWKSRQFKFWADWTFNLFSILIDVVPREFIKLAHISENRRKWIWYNKTMWLADRSKLKQQPRHRLGRNNRPRKKKCNIWDH